MTELTFDETTLGEVLKREEDTGSGGGGEQQKLPEESAAVWSRIKTSVTGLHDQWDRLEPQVAAENISQETIAGFEEALDRLTASVTDGNSPGTLAAANQLTRHLAKLMEPFAEPPTPQAYEMKYYLRETVLRRWKGNMMGQGEPVHDPKSSRRQKALKDQDAQSRLKN